jgi:hypothetical protein
MKPCEGGIVPFSWWQAFSFNTLPGLAEYLAITFRVCSLRLLPRYKLGDWQLHGVLGEPPMRRAALSDKPERACEGAGLRRSGRQLTPLGQGDRTILFEDITAVEVTVVVEVIVDRGMGSGKLLESLHAPEFRHRSFSSSERLV